jgi:hypothetical protein
MAKASAVRWKTWRETSIVENSTDIFAVDRGLGGAGTPGCDDAASSLLLHCLLRSSAVDLTVFGFLRCSPGRFHGLHWHHIQWSLGRVPFFSPWTMGILGLWMCYARP